MASFSVDISDIVFAGAHSGYKDITITDMPQAGVSCAITGTDTSAFDYSIPGNDQNVYRVYTTGLTTASTSSVKNAVFKITNLSDSSDYVEVQLHQLKSGCLDLDANIYGCVFDVVCDDTNTMINARKKYTSDSSYTYVYFNQNKGGYSTAHCTVLLDGDGWTIPSSSVPSWISLTQDGYTDTGFKQVAVSVTNNSDGPRQNRLNFRNADWNLDYVWVCQDGYPSSTSGCTTTLLVPASGGTFTTTLNHPSISTSYYPSIESPEFYRIYGSGYSKERLSKTTNESTFSITLPENTTGEEIRTFVYYYSMPGNTIIHLGHTIIIQAANVPGDLSVVPASLSFSADAGYEDISLTYGGSYYNVDATEVYTWTTIALSDVSTGYTTGTVSVASNVSTSSRRGNVYFSDELGASIALPIEQAGITYALSAVPSSLSFPASGGSSTTAVTYEGTLSAASLPSWLSQSYVDVDANHRTYTVTATSNGPTASRTFNWRLDDSYNHCWVLISQEAREDINLVISPSSSSVGSSSGTVEITVTSSGISEVSYVISAGWIEYLGKSGRVYTFSYAANGTTDARQGTITFSGGGLSRTFTLSQAAGSTGELTATPSSLNFTSSGGEKTIVFTYTGGLHMRDDEPDWITNVSYSIPDPMTYYITAGENTTEYAREWDAYFYDDNSSLYVPVIQNGTITPSLSVSPTSGSVDGNSGSTGITVTASGIRSSDISYQISGSWLSYTTRTDYTFYFSYPENTSGSSRTATITFSAFGRTATYTLTQQAPGAPASLSISPTSKTVSGATGRVDITVNQTGIENLQYTFSSNSGFVFSHIEGNVYVFSYGPNTSTLQSRTATITFSGAGLSQTFTLNQQPQSTTMTLDLIPTSDSVDGGSGYVYVTVSANRMSYSSISRSINGSWLSYVSSAGWIDKYLYRANPTGVERTATVTYTGEGGLTKIYTIVQDESISPDDSRSLKAYPKKLRYYSEGGGILVSFTNRPTAGIGYTITYIDGSGWLSVENDGPDKYVSATANNGTRRRAEIRFYDLSDNTNYVIVPVIQGSINGYNSIWMDDLFYPEDRDENGLYYYRVVDHNSNQEYFRGVSAKPTSWAGNIGGIDIPRLVDNYLGSFINDRGAAEWIDMNDSYCTVDIYNMTEDGYPGVVDETFKYWNDWSRFEKKYDYTRSLNDPINGRGCDNMFIPFCVYYDDAATFSIVDTEKNGNVNTYTLSTPTAPFMMQYDSYYDTKKLEYMQDDEVIFSYDMDHCGPGAFIYRNRFGGWDSFLVEGNIIKTDNYTKLNWRRKGEYNQRHPINTYKYIDEKVTDSVDIDTTYEAYTGWLTDEESERLVFHLLSSPIVYFQNLHKENQLFDTDPLFGLMPIRITGSSAEYKKFRNGKRMVNYLITFEKGNIEKVRN